jgi:hypothetical protein
MVAAEDVVFFAVSAVRALQAADQEHSHSDRHEDGECVIGGCEPMDQVMHIECPWVQYIEAKWAVPAAFRQEIGRNSKLHVYYRLGYGIKLAY